MKITIITTGGTIDKIYFDRKSEFQVGEPQILDVFKEANVTLQYDVIPLMQKDSLDLTDEDRELICRTIESSQGRRFVVTHGTDTMITTAKVLKRAKGKVIVLTGAMQPARFRSTDAVFNIGCALMAVQLLPNGVYVTMNGRVFHPDRTRKNDQLRRLEELDPA